VKTSPIKTLVAVDRSTEQKTLDAALDDPGIEVVGVVEQQGDLALRADLQADVLLIACNGHSELALAFLQESRRERPELPVVVASVSGANGFVRQVFELGADDLVMLAESPAPGADTFFALQKAIARRTGGGGTEHASGGSLITVLGPKGGTGKTLTTANLGCALAAEGHRTVALDLDLQFGDLALALGVVPVRTLFDLATSGGALDADKLDAYLAEHPSGLRVLCAPLRPDQASGVTVEFLRELYPVLRTTFDYVLVDTPPGFTPEVIATIDSSSAVTIVGMLDAPSLKNTKLGLETLELMGYPREKIRVVLNRSDASVGITHGDVLGLLGRPPDALVPSQREIVRSINRGDPIVLSAKRSEPAKVFRALAQLYVNDRAPAPTQQRSVRRRLIGGRS
jgi:pilus assembly protein CpaE